MAEETPDTPTNRRFVFPRWTNYLLNCPSNRDGLLDASIVSRLTEEGAAWSPDVNRPALPAQAPLIEHPYTPVAATSTSGVADDDEQALSEMLQTLASAQNRETAQLLSAIDRALRTLKLEPADFGACEDCGEDIPARRLAVMPWAALCTSCQSKLDPKRNVARKKITDYR